jgi:hypothetical protein
MENHGPAINRDDSLEEALGLAELGYHVVAVYPIRNGACACGKPDCLNPGKHPIGGDSRATRDPARIREQWSAWPDANVAVQLGRSGLVDVSSDSAEALIDFRARGLPETACWQSGSGQGHEHHLFRRPEDCPLDRDCQSGVLDLMSDGVAVLPPSVSGKGKYLYIRPLNIPATELPVAPRWAVDALIEKQRKSKEIPELDPFEPVIEIDSEKRSGEAWRRFTGQRLVYTPDGRVDRSESLFLIGAALAEYFNTSTIAAALEERDIALGWHKFSDRASTPEYRKIALRVVKDRREADQVLARMNRTRGAPSSAEPSKPRFMFLTEEEVHTRPDPTWRIAGILPTDANAQILAEYGHYKTFIAIGIAKAIAWGIPWAGFETEQARVAYIAGEGASGLKLRLEALNRHHDRGPSPYFHLLPQSAQLVEGDDIDHLLFALDALPDMPQLVFIDTQARMTAGANENSTQDMGKYVRNVDRIRDLTGGSTLSLHHLNREGEYRGSSVVPGALDTWMKITRAGAGVRIDCEKQKDADAFPSFTLIRQVVPLGRATDGKELTSLIFVPLAEAKARSAETGKIELVMPVSGDASENAILLALQGTTESTPYSRQAIQDRSSFGKSRTSDLLKRLVEHGYVETAGRSTAARYWLTELGGRRLAGEAD